MRLLEPHYSINQAVGIAITIRKDGSILLDGCQVMVKDKQLHLEKKMPNIGSVEELGKQFNRSIPVALNLSGKGVLYKQLPGKGEISPVNFSTVFPNANPEDFYIQHFISGDQSFIALIRKTDADKWLDALIKRGFRACMLSLGPFPVQHILPQLNMYGEELVFNGYRIDRDEALRWKAYHYDESAKAPFPIKIDNEAIDQELVMPYAAAFQLVLSARLDVIQAGVPELQLSLEQLLADKKFKVHGFLILLVCFLLLLINFITFSSMNNDNGRLSQQVSSSTQNTNDAQTVKEGIAQQEALLQNLGWEGVIRKSILIDQIASLLPPEVSWKEIAVDPVDRLGSRAQRSLQFSRQQIEVRGISAQIIPVNEWIARIKTLHWVKAVQLESYTYNNELNTGQFILTINY
jgi:Tfp pilus assembly protein PilN